MMQEEKEIVKIVIPSAGRAESVLTKKAIVNAVLCVPEVQAAEYKEHNPDMEILTHPNKILGITKKRQWIVDHFGGGDVFFMDDDIKYMFRMYQDKGDPQRVKPQLAYDIIQQTAATAYNMGAYLFGFSKNGKPLMYVSQQPFSLTGFLVGGWSGILKGSKLYYPVDSDCVAVDDYFISGLNAHIHRHCFIDNRFSFRTMEFLTNDGGTSGQRTRETEMNDTLWLREQFGEAIQVKKYTGQRKILHPYERTLKIPF